jgi:hypothetical protein
MNTSTEETAQDNAKDSVLEHTDTLYCLFYKTEPPATPQQAHEALAKEGFSVSTEEIARWKEGRDKIEEDVHALFQLIEEAFHKLIPSATKEQGRLLLIRFIMLEAIVTKDGKLALQAVDREQAEVDGKRKDRQLDQQDFKNVVLRERFEWEKQVKDVLKSTKNAGCITQETLEMIERELKLL